MTNPASNPWDLGGGGESFPFDHVGDEVEGFIQDMTTRQGTDMQTQEPDWWDEAKTRPKMLTVLTLQTTIRDNPKDDGMRTVTLSGSKKPAPDGGKSRMCAARDAVRAATGGTEMEFNAWFKMKYVADGPRTKIGFNPPKYYEAWYRPPVMNLDGVSTTAPANQLPANYGQAQGQTGAVGDPAHYAGQPGVTQGVTPQPGANWPVSNTAPGTPGAAGIGNPAVQQAQALATPANGQATPGTITAAQVEAIKAAVGPNGLDAVFGVGWEGRVVP